MLFAFYLVDSGVRDISFMAAKKMPCNTIRSINNLKISYHKKLSDFDTDDTLDA